MSTEPPGDRPGPSDPDEQDRQRIRTELAAVLREARDALAGTERARAGLAADCLLDAADAADKATVADRLDAEAARSADRIRHASEALRRLDEGTYGSCEACGKPIGRERLTALPLSRLCVDCSAGREA
ncbi:TraR/DksA family transcriptional regulator [Actinacidiphila sp. bgisy160]|uniref:TraR/DksA family transcriptional regulator n=1 Tax=Actinacidiphila sp. bgisy160 TaxID=3413796 RepID=UPI003D760075